MAKIVRMVVSCLLSILPAVLITLAPNINAAPAHQQFRRGARCITTVTTSPLNSSQPIWPGWSSGLKHLFVFGDSYSTIGFDPSGVQPAPNNPLGNPNPTRTSCNGPNWVELMTTLYNASLLQTYDFAFSGATVDEDVVPPWTSPIKSLKQQIQDQFLPEYAAHNPSWNGWTGADSLFAIWIGINDIGATYSRETMSDVQASIFLVYSSLLQKLYTSGARNFLFINVPPVQRSPLTLASVAANPNAVSQESQAIELWNQRLVDLMDNFKANHTDVTAFLHDANWLFNAVLDNPRQFPQTAGYRNVSGFCAQYAGGTAQPNTLIPSCTYPVNQYFWLNNLHPTYPMHNLTAFEIVQTLSGGAFSTGLQKGKPGLEPGHEEASKENDSPERSASEVESLIA